MNTNYINICSNCGKKFTLSRKNFRKRNQYKRSVNLCEHCLRNKTGYNENDKYFCINCGKEFTLSRDRYTKRRKNNIPMNICKYCLKSIRSRSRWENLSSDEIIKIMQNMWSGHKKWLSNGGIKKLNNNEWVKLQCSMAKGISDIHNDINYIQEDPLLKELETRLTKLGYIFIREYPTFILLDKEYKTDIPIEILYCKNIEDILSYQIKDSNNNPRPGFRKNWDYLITIPFSDKRLFLDIDGNIHSKEYEFNEEYMNNNGKYINDRFNTKIIGDINKYYDQRRIDIVCDKMLFNLDNFKLINNLIYKINEYFKYYERSVNIIEH